MNADSKLYELLYISPITLSSSDLNVLIILNETQLLEQLHPMKRQKQNNCEPSFCTTMSIVENKIKINRKYRRLSIAEAVLDRIHFEIGKHYFRNKSI